MVNHPKMSFLGWNQYAADQLRALGAYLELGILPDILGGPDHSSLSLVDEYPDELLVFGADLGHAHHPSPLEAMPVWLHDLEKRVGEKTSHQILAENGKALLLR
jgi:hypothetical protein